MRASADQFASTRWTQVFAAASPEHPESQSALTELCRTYWPPLYAYVRRRGHSPADAEDLTQGFFARLLRLESLASVQKERGRFRAFLLASMQHYLADVSDHERAAKRGRDAVIPMDAVLVESRYRIEPAEPSATPDQAFDRAWALALLERVAGQLQSEYAAAGQGELFAALSFSIGGRGHDVAYAELAARLHLNEPAVRVAVHRLRSRYRQQLRAEIARTVASPEEIDQELRYLRQALAG